MIPIGHADLLGAVRATALGRPVATPAKQAAEALGLAADDELTSAGRRLYEDGILRRDNDATREALSVALGAVSALRALLEGEWGIEVTRQQAEEVLQYGYPPSRAWKSADFTKMFELLNFAGLIVFNRKRPTIRVLAASPTAKPNQDGTLITPATPYRNKRLTIELLRAARTSIFWFDRFLDREALSFIYENADFSSVRDIRLLSGGRSAVTNAAVDDYKRIRAELGARSITIEWRTLLAAEESTNKHDRWLRIDDRLWNVPPLTLILSGKYGSVVPDRNAVPLDEWWDQATDFLAVATARPVAAAS